MNSAVTTYVVKSVSVTTNWHCDILNVQLERCVYAAIHVVAVT
jgi:hypothetical protein